MTDDTTTKTRTQSTELPFKTATERVDDVCDELDISEEAVECAHEIAGLFSGLDARYVIGNSPSAIAAGAVYLSTVYLNCKDYTNKEVCTTANVAAPTGRSARRAMEDRAEELPSERGEKYTPPSEVVER